jgi:hypothetical protein
MLFGSTALEVAIGMVFVYLLLSLLCSAINEYIESLLNFRATNLRRGIELLLNDTKGGGEDLAAKLYAHGLVRPLFRDGGKLPSYIPARTFALALWNMAGGTDTSTLDGIKQTINSLPNKELREALLTLVDEAGNDFNKARKNIEDWYDSAMDRVSGWYKRRAQVFLIIIGFVAAAAINADSVGIAKAFIRDPALRGSVAAAAEKYLAATPTPTPAPTPCTPTAQNPCPTPTAPPTPADAEKQLEAARAEIQKTRAQLDELGLPLGWVARDCEAWAGARTCAPDKLKNRDDLRRYPNGLSEWILKLFGIFLTALAISQGAPFWFDVLNKFMVIRSTVKPKEKSPDEGSKDKPAKGKGDHNNEDADHPA